jgi:hypothetical protein
MRAGNIIVRYNFFLYQLRNDVSYLRVEAKYNIQIYTDEKLAYEYEIRHATIYHKECI